MIKYIVLAIAILVPSIGNTAPSITSASISGGSISISGSGFGTKTSAPPIRFDNFEGLMDGANVSSETGWWQDSSVVSNRLKVSSAYTHSGTRSAIAAQTTAQAMAGSDPQVHRSDVGFATTHKALISMWVRWHWPDWAGGDPSSSPEAERALQYKLFRIASEVQSSGNVVYPHAALYCWKDYGGLGVDKSYVANNSASMYLPSNHLVNNEWHHITMLVDQGTQGNADGSITVYASKPGVTYTTTQSTGINIVGAAENYMDDIKIDNFIDYNNDTIVAAGATVSEPGIYFDDIYIDNTFQRVELCDASTKAASTHCEIQPPTAWGDSSATVTLNAGSFTEGAQVYALVYDASNAVASYGPLTIPADGGGGGSTGHYYRARISE